MSCVSGATIGSLASAGAGSNPEHELYCIVLLLQPAEPQLHRLDVNYRSHAGILDVASALVSVIQDFFPNTVDRSAQ
jgi:hypothetical protein